MPLAVSISGYVITHTGTGRPEITIGVALLGAFDLAQIEFTLEIVVIQTAATQGDIAPEAILLVLGKDVVRGPLPS